MQGCARSLRTQYATGSRWRGSSCNAQYAACRRSVIGPGNAPRSGRPSTLAIGNTPPPVELRKTSSARARSPAGTGSDAQRNRERFAQLEHGPARDAFEDAARRRANDAGADHEDVEARAFGDVAVAVDDAARVGAAVVGVEHRLHQVQPVVVLDRRVDRLGGDADAPADVKIDPGACFSGDAIQTNGTA